MKFWDPAARVEDDEIVFLRRKDGSVNFDRRWVDYQRGFGDPDGEFWLGLEALHQLTSTNDYSLRISVMAWEDHNFEENMEVFTGFRVGPYFDNYRLTLTGFDGYASTSSGTLLLGGVNEHNGTLFSTIDRANDVLGHCAINHRGGWWYNENCSGYARPTGHYLTEDHVTNYEGVLFAIDDFERSYSWKSLELTLVKVPTET